jgi:protein-disulfide isomerase
MNDALSKGGDGPRLVLPVGARDHAQGRAASGVTLLEYGDFECGHCAATFPVVKEVNRWLRGTLRYAFRHFPVAERHPNALRAAEAAEAAGAQGRFWEMHDLLCGRSPALGDVHLNGYARELGLDLERFGREMREHTHAWKVREDFTSGVRSGVSGTPAFFINGARYTGASDLDGLLAAIEEAGYRAVSGDK